MVHRVLEISNDEGLRAKAAALFVSVASKYASQVIIEKGNKKINAKSIMGVLSLGVTKGEPIHIIASGDDERQAIAALTELVKAGFKEN